MSYVLSCNKKKQLVKYEIDTVIGLIEGKEWSFSFEHMRRIINGYEWECKDADGIVIKGTTTILYTLVEFVFIKENIKVGMSESARLEKIILPEKQKQTIVEWKTKNRPGTSRGTNGSACVYCGSFCTTGTMCDKCRELYQKKRQGVGGYPAYDPMAQGNNSLKQL